MKSLNICIDIDGTITEPYYWMELANKYFNKNITSKDVIEYDMHKALNITREEFIKFYNIYAEELHFKADLREKAKPILQTINKKHNIYYVTAREPKMQEVTKKWFDINKLPKGELYLLGSHYKVEKARELECNVFIEDRYENALQLADSGFKVLLIDCEYNRYDLVSGITRVYNWEEILKEINNCDIQKKKEISVGIA